jgi:sugar phosphate isomerase/epimerase
VKLSCLPVSLYPDIIAGRISLGAWARTGAELGLDAVDASILFFPDRTPAVLARARRAVEGEGISLGMMSTYPDFTHPDARTRAREIDAARATIDIAAALGMSYVRAIAGQAHPGTERQAGQMWAVAGLEAMVKHSRGTGVEVVYENHDQAGVMAYPDFSARQEVFLAIYRATACFGLGINYDTGNATALTPNPLVLLDAVLDRVRTLHVSDTSAVGEHIRPCVIGTGLAPLETIFRRLHQANWDGYVSIEEASGTGREGIEVAVRHVRRLWQETRKDCQ